MKTKLAILAVALSAFTLAGGVLAQGPHHQGTGSQVMPSGEGMTSPRHEGRGMGMGMGMGMGGGGMMSRNCPMMGMMMNSEDGGTHTAGRIAFIKAELGITEGQKEAFESYATAVKKNLDNMQSMRSRMMSSMETATPVERLAGHIEMMEGRVATLKEVKPALEKLYGELTEEQKRKANAILGGMGCMM